MIVNKPVVVFDIETTGLDITKDQIIDISLIEIGIDCSEEVKNIMQLDIQRKIDKAGSIGHFSDRIINGDISMYDAIETITDKLRNEKSY